MIKNRERTLFLNSCAVLVTLALLTACGGDPPTPVAPAPTTTQPGTTQPGSGVVIPPVVVPPALGSVSGTVVFPGGSVGGAGLQGSASQPAAHRAGEVIPGQYLVRLRPNTGTGTLSTQSLSSQSLSTLAVGGVKMKRLAGSTELGVALYGTDQLASQSMTAGSSSTLSSSTLLAQIQALPQVLSAEPNVWYRALKTPNDTSFPLQWNMQAMNLPKAWDSTTGKAVTVAVVDSGIVAHPDLAGQVLPGMDFIQDLSEAGDGDGVDSNPTDLGGDSDYHGSHVAGIIAAQSNNALGVAGVSWGAKILPVRVLGVTGSGSSADVMLGIYWASGGHVDGVQDNPNPARIINLSLGGSAVCSASEQQMYDTLAAKGVIVTVAAGNENRNASLSSPANCNNVITVGATGPDGKRAPYSNYGARIDVMAPGGNASLGVTVNGKTYPGGILSTVYDDTAKDFRYAFYQGTSMAAPHVAGALALLLGEQPALTFTQVRARLAASSTPLGANCDISGGCGAGLVNVAALLSSTATAPAPVTTSPVVVRNGLAYVAALYTLPDGSFDKARSTAGLVGSSTLRSPFSFYGLALGKYTLTAWQDLNGNNVVDTGEPIGSTSAQVSQTALNVSGLSISMQAFSSAKQSSASGASPDLLPAALPATLPATLIDAVQSLQP